MGYAQDKYIVTHNYTRNECCSPSFSFENFHISILGYRKHFQYVCYLSNSTTKLKRISETNNTLRRHCSDMIQKFASHHVARGEIIKVYLLFILNLDYIKAYMREVKSSQNQGLDDFCSDNQSASKQLNTLQIKHFLKYCVGSILERA